MAATPLPAEAETTAPMLLAAHVDLLSRTSIDHGIEVGSAARLETGTPDVYPCWRAEFSPEVVVAAPPAQHELLAIPRYALRRWSADVADIEGGAPRREPTTRSRSPPFVDRADAQSASTPAARAPETRSCCPWTLAVRDRYGWAPRSSDPVSHVGDSERRIRLHPAVHQDFAGEIARLLGDDATTPDDSRALAREVGIENPGRVLAYPGACVVLNRSQRTPSSALRPVPLRTHQQQAAARAEALAQGSGLPPEWSLLFAAPALGTTAASPIRAGRRW